MNAGQMVRVGAAVDVWRDPGTEFVARFVGHEMFVDRGGVRHVVRSDAVRAVDAHAADVSFTGVVVECRFQGDRYRISVDVAGSTWRVWSSDPTPVGSARGGARPVSTGLVLGAGGAFGWAWHLGVLEAVRDELGVDVPQAVIGTSAGAAMAIASASGASTPEILDVITRRPDPETMQEMQRLRGELRKPWRWFRPMAPRLVLQPGIHNGCPGLRGSVASGRVPDRLVAAVPSPDNVAIEPANHCCSPRRRVSCRVVGARSDHRLARFARSFGGGTDDVVDGIGHVDGAVASATNADVLVARVIMSTPMTRPGKGLVRRRSRRQLRQETAALEAGGATVVTIEPTQSVVDLAEGYPRSNQTAGPAIVEAARALTLQALAGS
ncbi:hypothetical protein GQR58_030079 [Nymphon striatum]|nr:hypothetical protein GQR58_030079 [Nymphon striatum]